MIELSHITKAYKKRKVVDDFTLTVHAPIFGFLGQNGAGKTTIMKMMVGLTLSTAGTITIGGKPAGEAATKEMTGFMPESPYFYERLTGLEFLRFCGELFQKSRAKTDDDYGALLKKVGIYGAKDRYVSTYSKGMKQRLGFAQALVNDPEYIFLDEPLDGLDPVGRKEMKTIIRALKAEGRNVFFNSHILYDIEELCDEMGIVHSGKLLYAGPVKAFTQGKSLEERFVETVEAHVQKEGGAISVA
ncbi:MAG TPA: ABC transporter ATP-binding protein [Candidatus Paceibacterota bacterium]|nr:ABC transporter ATP-binding protein [Candidatus Paceibacterota bacterium]